jgi:outer membrane protein assembly factor BamB
MQGDLVWQRDFGDMRARNGFGEGSSPTLVDDMIIVPWDHEGPSALYALDKRTGKTIWKTERDEPTNWSTPLIVDHDGNRQIVMNGQNYARGYDLETGAELWRCSGQTQRPAASAVAGEGLIFVGSGFRGAFMGAFRPDATGDIANTRAVVWTLDRNTPDIATPVLSSGRLYFYKGKSGLLSCADASTGELFYSTVRTGLRNIYASPVVAAGRIYLSDRDGTTVVIEDSPEFKVLATNSIGETIDASPAPVDDELFIRGEQHLFCFSR